MESIQETETTQKMPILSGPPMPQQFSELQTVMNDMIASAHKYGGKPTKVEATRLRKHLMSLAKQCKNSRTCVLEEVKALPKIPRTSKKQPVNEQRQAEFVEEEAEEVVNEGKKRRKPRKAKK